MARQHMPLRTYVPNRIVTSTTYIMAQHLATMAMPSNNHKYRNASNHRQPTISQSPRAAICRV
ncbi:hypothetical protein M404DRAFT_1007485 [Pisolithus tinctorius Marx 270]|uniref:Uncharacterized protein n=1 Tax=Pisolithus tinctorius Marx 270 TaxID=870435 RepID=A0A0C3NJ88_PISTI|nr:hypothetical protein M404DRAFT_1007485 [Pisolithus tinctorius Marx 270]